jgi:hypothetical protein
MALRSLKDFGLTLFMLLFRDQGAGQEQLTMRSWTSPLSYPNLTHVVVQGSGGRAGVADDEELDESIILS